MRLKDHGALTRRSVIIAHMLLAFQSKIGMRSIDAEMLNAILVGILSRIRDELEVFPEGSFKLLPLFGYAEVRLELASLSEKGFLRHLHDNLYHFEESSAAMLTALIDGAEIDASDAKKLEEIASQYVAGIRDQPQVVRKRLAAA